MTLEVSGPDVDKLDNEAGAFRLQRIPPTEKQGRVHSSTVTVAVMKTGGKSSDTSSPWDLRGESDFVKEWFSGSGGGGQHRNKHMNSIRLVHVPTGVVKQAQTRSRENSLMNAMTAMVEELDRMGDRVRGHAANTNRRDQMGSGERSDKRRTFRIQEGKVHDHVTGRSATVDKVMAGHFELLWA